MNEWNSDHHWRKTTEKRLAQIHSQVEGLHAAHATRVVDLVEQVEELRKALEHMESKHDTLLARLKVKFEEIDNGS